MSTGRGLRVCHLGKFYPPATGGMEMHVQTLARAQAALGADVHVVCVNHQASSGNDVTWRARAITPPAEELDRGVRITRLGRVASVSRLDFCPALLQVLDDVKRRGVDVVHVHAPNPTMFLALLAARLRVALVVTHHSDIVKQTLLAIPFSVVERLVHRRARLVFATSEAYVGGSPVLQKLGAKVRSLPLGLDLKPFTEPGEEALAFAAHLRTTHGSPLWLAVGRLVYYKGFENAIDALADVPGTLLIVGRGPLARELRVRAQQRGVSDRVVWRDYLTPHELVGAYQAATAFWFSSNARSEAFGLAQVEAMASGCPVINMSIPGSGVTWVAPDGVAALTTQVNDAPGIAVAARRLLEDASFRTHLATGGKRRAVQHFGHRTMAAKSLSLYQEALDLRDGPTERFAAE